MPSFVLLVAPTGHTLMQGGCSHCMQGTGIRFDLIRGYSPSIRSTMRIQLMDRDNAASSGFGGGMLFSIWQAMTHAWHAVHLSRSITIPHLLMPSSLCLIHFDPGMLQQGFTGERICLGNQQLANVFPNPICPASKRLVS